MNSAGLEAEIKIPVADLDAVREALARSSAIVVHPRAGRSICYSTTTMAVCRVPGPSCDSGIMALAIS